MEENNTVTNSEEDEAWKLRLHLIIHNLLGQ